MSKAVDKLYEFYKFSLTLEKAWPMLMDTECGSDQPECLRANVALAKQVALLFDFVFHFDEAKMINPAIQNDFSYYRRVLSRMKNANKDEKAKVKVDEELANKMSFFFAYPTPMMKVIIDATTEFDKVSPPVAHRSSPHALGRTPSPHCGAGQPGQPLPAHAGQRGRRWRARHAVPVRHDGLHHPRRPSAR